LILLTALAVGAALLLGLVVATLNGLFEFYQRWQAMPFWLRVPSIIVAALVLGALCWLLWRLARPSATSMFGASVPLSRGDVEARIESLRERQADTTALEAELVELDRRRVTGEVYVALFGEISTGKSSLIRALAAQTAPAVDVRGGTTRRVEHHRGVLPDGRALILADVPGSREIDGIAHEQIARDEALRAHAVVYLAAGDLTRAQDTEIGWLADFRKPIVLALNKTDLYGTVERTALLARLHERYARRVREIVAISAGGSERYERTLTDGRRERVERERIPDIAPLLSALERIAQAGTDALEPAREVAVLAEVGRRGDALARATAAHEAQRSIAKYTRRAIVGAMAAVAPGSDLLIQGALGTALVRELARIHGVPVRELDVEALLARVGLSVRNTTAVVLAIAGNALKAFPGLGTLGGGVLHAIAYGLVFDSLGHALAATLATHAALDAADVEARIGALLAEPQRERIEHIARLALDAARGERT
jgi:GTPase SAR1 family protein